MPCGDVGEQFGSPFLLWSRKVFPYLVGAGISQSHIYSEVGQLQSLAYFRSVTHRQAPFPVLCTDP
jgi:hypothetical protein